MSTPPATGAAEASATWLDDGELDPAWGSPAGPVGRRPRPLVVAAAVVLVLVLAVGLVWRLGGFELRTDVVTDAAVGSTIETGPYELRFVEATAQRYTPYGGQPVWKLTAVGEGRTTGSESIAPKYSLGDGMFIAKDPTTGEQLQDAEALHFRAGSFIASSESFTPGLPMQPFGVEYRFAGSYQPGATLTFLVYDLEFRDTSLLGNQDPQWANAGTAHRLRLPVRVIPPETS